MKKDIIEQEDVEINLLTLLLSMLKHWRSLLVFVAIGLVIGFAFPNFSTTEDAEILESQQSIEALYHQKQLVDKAQEYIAESLYFKIDPNNAYVGTLKFSVSAQEETETIAQRFASILNDADFAADVQAACGQDVQWQYLKEMIACSIARYEYSAGISDSLTVMPTDVITMTVMMDNEADCTAILNVIRTYVDAARGEMGLSSEYQSLVDMVQVQVAESVKNVRLNKEEELAEYQEEYQTQLDALSETEQTIYTGIYITGETDKETAFAEMETSGVKLSVKAVLFGAFLGVVIWGFGQFVPYVASDCLRDKGEVQSFSTLPVLACVRTARKNAAAADRWVDSLWTRSFEPYQSEEYLCKLLLKNAEQSVTLSFSETSDAQKALAERVCAACPQVSRRPNYHNSVQSIAELQEADRVIVLVEIGVTKRAVLISELETLRRCGADIVGLVVLD